MNSRTHYTREECDELGIERTSPPNPAMIRNAPRSRKLGRPGQLIRFTNPLPRRKTIAASTPSKPERKGFAAFIASRMDAPRDSPSGLTRRYGKATKFHSL